MKHLTILSFILAFLTACSLYPDQLINAPTQTVQATLPPTVTSKPTEVPLTPTLTPTLIPSATPTPYYPEEGFGPQGFPGDVNPLTGLYVSDPGVLDRRPLAFKVNIVPRNVRPPWGLSLADIVYDYYHNDGYTRYFALFYGQDADLVGPIRSGRLPDDALIQMYKSIFVYGGADSKIDSRFLNAGYSDRLVRERGAWQNTACPPEPSHPLCRFEPSGYNHLLGSTKAIHAYLASQGIQDSHQNLDGMYFRMDPPEGGSPAEQVTTRYSIDDYNLWEYDPPSGKYLRFQDDLYLDQGQAEEYTPLMDRLNDEQISADNVVILFVPHAYLQPQPHEIVEIYLNSSGLAYAFRDGLAYEVRWNHLNPEDVLYLTFPDGSNYPFKPGNTWFQVVGHYTQTSQPEERSWRFEFLIP